MAATELNSTPLISDATLKAYYRFESGALTTDSSGEGHTLTAISDPAEDASGKFGGAVALDGNDAYSAVDHADFKPTGNFTIGGWVKANSDTGMHLIISSYSQNTNVAGIQIGINVTNESAHKAVLLSGKNSGVTGDVDYKRVLGGTTVDDGVWHFIVGTWDGSNLRLYVDGTLDATAVSWANAPAYAATNYVRVGCEKYGASAEAKFFNGSLDDVFLFNGKALSATEISNLYNGTNKNLALLGVG